MRAWASQLAVVFGDDMNFSIRDGDLELRSCNNSLLRDGEHTTAEIIEWFKVEGGGEHCYVLAHWRKDKEGYYLEFCGKRPFSVGKKKFMKLAKIGQEELEKLGKN